MMRLVLNPPLLGFIAGTRAMLGVGIGLLVASRIPEARRRTVGLTLLAIGAATTIPAAIAVFGANRDGESARRQPKDLFAAGGSAVSR